MIIGLCQLNPTAGNLQYNLQRIENELGLAKAAGADIVIFPELSLMGYPPRDLLENDWFLRDADAALDRLVNHVNEIGVACIVGTAVRNDSTGKKPLHNAAIMLTPGGHRVIVRKKLLPNYDVFDEHRYFEPFPCESPTPLMPHGDKLFGCTVCEDIWNDNEFWLEERLYSCDPVASVCQLGADFIVNISASTFTTTKAPRRMEMLRHTAKRWNRPVIFVNQLGGCDHVIFDGGSCVMMPDGTVAAHCGWFKEKTVYWDTEVASVSSEFPAPVIPATIEALGLGLTDYLRKTGFEQVVVGNSGGIDSALVLTLATRFLGPDNVISITMPSIHTSEETRADADLLARNLGIRHLTMPITGPHESFQALLSQPDSPLVTNLFDADPTTVARIADENLQARIRGNILMYVTNAITEKRTLVLSTGNKSELAVGYCTLYGDMCGGLSLISDVPKTMVYEIAEYLNDTTQPPIPDSIFCRAPTAELAPGQKDSDSLPPYEVLDPIIKSYVEDRMSVQEIIEMGLANANTITRVIQMIDNSEYKRAQAAPGLKITSKAFGVGRRMPIARG